MPRRRRIEVTVEREEFYILRQPQTARLQWCAGCGQETEMLPPEVAGGLTGVTARTIYRWAEAGLIHFAETPDGLLIVCQRSPAEMLTVSRRQIADGKT